MLGGAGGAATAIAFAFVEAEVVTNPVAANAAEIVERVARFLPGSPIRSAGPDPSGFQLIINAVLLSMWEHEPLPIDTARLAASIIVAETMAELNPWIRLFLVPRPPRPDFAPSLLRRRLRC